MKHRRGLRNKTPQISIIYGFVLMPVPVARVNFQSQIFRSEYRLESSLMLVWLFVNQALFPRHGFEDFICCWVKIKFSFWNWINQHFRQLLFNFFSFHKLKSLNNEQEENLEKSTVNNATWKNVVLTTSHDQRVVIMERRFVITSELILLLVASSLLQRMQQNAERKSRGKVQWKKYWFLFIGSCRLTRAPNEGSKSCKCPFDNHGNSTTFFLVPLRTHFYQDRRKASGKGDRCK